MKDFFPLKLLQGSHAANNRLAPRGFTLVEVMVASTISVLVIVSSITSIVYYQRVSAKNDRLGRVANVLEGHMETVLSKTWYELADPLVGACPPGGAPKDPSDPESVAAAGRWPAPNEIGTRQLALRGLSRYNLVPDSTMTPYTGVGGTLDVYYTPFTVTHTAISNSKAVVQFDVHYYKIEVIYTADAASRVRSGSDGRDVWSLITYLSEMSGRTDAEFTQQALDSLRARQYLAAESSGS